MHEIDYVHKKWSPKDGPYESSAAGQYAHVKFRITPEPAGTGFKFVNATTHQQIPNEFVPGVEEGVRDVVGSKDITVELIDGAYHDIDSSILSFELAGKYAMEKAIQDFGL